MIELNLLAESLPGPSVGIGAPLSRIRRAGWRTQFGLLCLFSSATYVAWTLISLGSRETRAAAALPAAISDSTVAAKRQTASRTFLAARDSLARRLVLLDSLHERRSYWLDALAQILEARPRGVWFTSIAAATPDRPRRMAIGGVAHSASEVTVFGDRMLRSSRFRSVAVEGPDTDQTRENGWTPNLSFSMTVTTGAGVPLAADSSYDQRQRRAGSEP